MANQDVIVFKYKILIDNGKQKYIMPTESDFNIPNDGINLNDEIYKIFSTDDIVDIIKTKLKTLPPLINGGNKKGGNKNIRKTAKKIKNKKNKTLRFDRI